MSSVVNPVAVTALLLTSIFIAANKEYLMKIYFQMCKFSIPSAILSKFFI